MANYTFTTLAIGDEYVRKVQTLLDCVMVLTGADLIIITDNPSAIDEYIELHRYDKSRVHIILLSDVTDHRTFHSINKFNYNLKLLPTEVAYGMDKYSLIIHVDADCFFIGWDEAGAQRFIDFPNRGLIARLRNPPKDEAGLFIFTKPKAELLGINMDDIDAGMPIEVFMFFKPDCAEFPEFMRIWREMVDLCYERDINPFAEALEMSYAISKSKLPHQQLFNFFFDFPFLSNLRYLHHDKIMRVF